jgi:hypothetical protein
MAALGWILRLCLLLSAAACSSTVRVTVNYSGETNGGLPLYLMVRAGEVENLANQSYDEAAEMVFAVPRDPSVQKIEAILPGRDPLNFYLTKPDEGDLVIYFFFTKPRAKWTYRIPRPIPSEVKVELGDSEVLNQ